jgi:aryl-alcohol dehydrogenase-like predicted oxidoreductase
MARYNAAHRGAEEALFPVTAAVGLPVVAYTALRWGDLLRPTPDDPAGFAPPSPAECYRFVLAHPAVTAALMAPANAAELEADLRLLDDWRGLEPGRDAALRAHGDRVRRHAPSFP